MVMDTFPREAGSATDGIAMPAPARHEARSCFTRIATDIDVAPFLSELAAAPEMWLADTSRQRKVRCQRDTRTIFLRVAKKPLPPGARNANDVHECRTARSASPFPRALAFCERIAELQGGELGRATLVALQPRGWVLPHVDAGAYYRVRDRFPPRSTESGRQSAHGGKRNLRDARRRAVGLRQQGRARRSQSDRRAPRAPDLRCAPPAGAWLLRLAAGRLRFSP